MSKAKRTPIGLTSAVVTNEPTRKPHRSEDVLLESIDLALAFASGQLTGAQCAEAMGLAKSNNIGTRFGLTIMAGLRAGLLRVEKVK